MFKAFHRNELVRMMVFMGSRLRVYLLFLLIYSLLQALFGIIIALVLKDMINAAVLADFSLLIRAAYVIISATLIFCVFSPISRYFYIRCVRKTIADIKIKAYAHIQQLPLAYFEKVHSGDTLSTLTNDIQALEAAYADDFYSIVYSLLFGMGTVIAMLILDWRIALVLVSLGILTAWINRSYANTLLRIGDAVLKKLGSLTACFTDLFSGFFVMKMFHIETVAGKKFDIRNSHVASLSLKRVQKIAVLTGANYLIGMLNFAGIVAAGAFMVSMKKSDFGTLTALVQLQISLNYVIIQIGSAFAKIQNSLAGAGRLFDLLNRSTESENWYLKNPDAKKPVESNNDIEIYDVVFRYNEDKNTLDRLSISVGQGKIAALVGPSGGGKSTVLKMLMGFYPHNSGSIVIKGKEIGEYSLEELRDMIAYVPQDAYLFDGTVEENIRYGSPDATMDEIIKAANAAYAHEFILQLPDGYNTLVGERGGKLSGGQRQRIAIARALLKNAPILLLDEATSALDSESEKLVRDALDILTKGRTTLMVAHRISTVEHCDEIYVIDEGKVAEQGSYEALASENGLFERLIHASAKG